MLLLDLIDLQGMKAAKKGAWKPLPRPWRRKGQRFGQTDLPPEEAKELLRRNAGR